MPHQRKPRNKKTRIQIDNNPELPSKTISQNVTSTKATQAVIDIAFSQFEIHNGQSDKKKVKRVGEMKLLGQNFQRIWNLFSFSNFFIHFIPYFFRIHFSFKMGIELNLIKIAILFMKLVYFLL